MSDLFTVRLYCPALREVWDGVVMDSVNGNFMHHRGFIEYHGQKYVDFSLLVFLEGEALGVLPAEREGDIVFSHRGLTYAGLILKNGVDTDLVEVILESIIGFYRTNGIEKLELRLAPEFYFSQSYVAINQNFMFPPFRNLETKGYQTVPIPAKIQDRGKNWGIKKAKEYGIEIGVSDEWGIYWENILYPNLWERHRVRPTHSLSEIRYLQSLFPKNIFLYTASLRKEILGGIVLFVSEQVVHSQYVSATPKGKKLRVLDLLVSQLITETFSHKKYFSMGVSHDPKTGILNQGLVNWKESFGAKVYEGRVVGWRLKDKF
jgi:hypothetical protein